MVAPVAVATTVEMTVMVVVVGTATGVVETVVMVAGTATRVVVTAARVMETRVAATEVKAVETAMMEGKSSNQIVCLGS